jgi:hypothetical protein
MPKLILLRKNSVSSPQVHMLLQWRSLEMVVIVMVTLWKRPKQGLRLIIVKYQNDFSIEKIKWLFVNHILCEV